MTNCTGLMGKIFGHNYKKYPTEWDLYKNEIGYVYAKEINFTHRCKRCGGKLK